MDGLIYGAVAKNLSIGQGDFWHLKFSETLLQPFHEHPPLAFYLESLFFRLIGDHYFTERCYTLFITVLTAIVMLRLFKRLGGSGELAWLSVLLWISTDRVFWSSNQNMLEVTMSFFSILSVYLLYSAESKVARSRLLYQLSAALFLLAAFLSKGFPGLFPLGFYFFTYLSSGTRSFVDFIKNTAVLSGFLIGITLLLFIWQPDAYASISKWFLQQVSGSVQGLDRTGLRLPFISGFFQQLLPMLILLFLLLLWEKRKKGTLPRLATPHKVLLYTGFSAFLPLLISPKLSFYYFVPAIPYFALFTAHYLQEHLPSSIIVKEKKGWRLAAGALLLVSLVYSFAQTGKAERDKNLMREVTVLKSLLVAGTHIAVSDALSEDWTLFAYLQRMGGFNVSKDGTSSYFLQKTEELPPPDSKEILTQLSEFRLFLVYNKL